MHFRRKLIVPQARRLLPAIYSLYWSKCQKRTDLGEMEPMVLLAVVRLGEDAYGVPISKELLILAGWQRSCPRKHLRSAGQTGTERFRVFDAWRPDTRAWRPRETLFQCDRNRHSNAEDDPRGTDESMERYTAVGRKAFMSGNKSNPPGLAIWWLRHACPGSNDALTGDLIERFREGQTRGWFWRQVLIAFIVSVLGEIRRHWPHFSYAIAGTVLLLFFWDAPALRHVRGWFHWNNLPWPWVQLQALPSRRPALLALAALPILAAGLVIERSFRWASLARTAAINPALITFGHYSIDLFPSARTPPWCLVI